jgi:hypothetical protein
MNKKYHELLLCLKKCSILDNAKSVADGAK